MKSLSKLHKEAIIKAQNATDANRAAAMAMIETPIEMIKAILLKHEIAIIEVLRELHESREAAVRAEREACAKVCDVLAVHPEYASDITKLAAKAIRARGNT